MKKTSIIPITIFAAAFCSSSFGALWLPLKADSELMLSIDLESIQRNGPIVTIWSKWEYTSPQTDDYNVSGKTYRIALTRTSHDCQESNSRLLQRTLYTEPGGQLVNSISLDASESKSASIVPDTLGEVLHKDVCRRKPLK